MGLIEQVNPAVKLHYSSAKPQPAMDSVAAGAIRSLIALIALYLVLAVAYSMVTPAFEAPDEIAHFEFIMHLRREGQLPVQQLGHTGASHHPPLYYAIAAIATLPADLDDHTIPWTANPAFVWAGQGGEPNIVIHHTAETFPYQGQALALHLARLVSVLMGAGTVLMTVLLGWRLFPAFPAVGLLAGVLVAFNPQFLFVSGAINNDNLLSLLVTAILLLAVRALRQPEPLRQWMQIGFLLGLTLLTKTNGVIVCAVVGIMVTIIALRRWSLTFFLRTGLALGIPLLLVTSWWFWRNIQLYGDPLGWAMFDAIYASALRQQPLTNADLRHFFTTQLNSFWALFGWMTVWAPSWFYTTIRVLVWGSAVGLILFLVRRWRDLAPFQQAGFLLIVGAAVAQEAFMLYSITRINEAWYQGRYLFVVVAPLMVLASLGLLHLVPRVGQRFLLAGVASMALVVAVYMPVAVIAPAYHTIPQPKHVLWTVEQRTDYYFADGMLALQGYDLRIDKEAATLDLVLYWQALDQVDFNYSAFVHLVDGDGQLIAQKDHAPGEEHGYPPMVWRPQDIVMDLHLLPLPDSGLTADHRLRLGLYNWETGQQLPITRNGEFLGGFVLLTP